MASKAARRVFFSKPLEILLLVIFFLSFNIYILSLFEVKLEPKEKVGQISELPCPPAPTAVTVTSNFEEQIEQDGQIITFEEDGRFGNLLMETATLILIGQNHNVPVKILPQVGAKLSKYLSPLPAPVVDHTKHCICTYCTDCLCPTCQKWTKVASWTYMKSPATYDQKYVLLKWFNSDLVLGHLGKMRSLFKPLLQPTTITEIQTFFHELQAKRGKALSFVSIHVRRTDYVQWIEKRYKGHVVDHRFFKHCMDTFRTENPDTVFIVTSDDISWCRENLKGDDVIFPEINHGESDPIVTDFILLTQTNHSIYDYGSFGFWGAALAGGRTMVADGYSDKIHPILAAIRKAKPENWTRVDVANL